MSITDKKVRLMVSVNPRMFGVPVGNIPDVIHISVIRRLSYPVWTHIYNTTYRMIDAAAYRCLLIGTELKMKDYNFKND